MEAPVYVDVSDQAPSDNQCYDHVDVSPLFNAKAFSQRNHAADNRDIHTLAALIERMKSIILPLTPQDKWRTWVLLYQDSMVHLSQANVMAVKTVCNALNNWPGMVNDIPDIVSFSKSELVSMSVETKVRTCHYSDEYVRIIGGFKDSGGGFQILTPHNTSDARHKFFFNKKICDASVILLSPRKLDFCVLKGFQWKSTVMQTALQILMQEHHWRCADRRPSAVACVDPPVWTTQPRAPFKHGTLSDQKALQLRRVDCTDHGPTIILHPQRKQGFSNRFNMLVTSLWLAHQCGAKLQVHWMYSAECPCSFGSMFGDWFKRLPDWVNVPKIEVFEDALPQIPAPWKHEPIAMLTEFCMSVHAAAFLWTEYCDMHTKKKPGVIIRPWDMNIIDFATCCVELHADIHQKAQTWFHNTFDRDSQCTGFHIRRGDLKAMLETQARKQGYDAQRPYNEQLRLVREALNASTSAHVYVACDTKTTYIDIMRQCATAENAHRLHFNPDTLATWNAKPIACADTDLRETTQE